MKEIQLTITIDEANLILEGLGGMPFKRVFGLIGKIQQQAGEQLQASAAETKAPSTSLQITNSENSEPEI